MKSVPATRRQFLARSASVAGALALEPYWTAAARAAAPSKTGPFRVAAIGLGGRGRTIAGYAAQYGPLVAVCDVRPQHAEAASQKLAGGKAAVYQDYRKLLDRKDVDVVTIGTPEHWHAKIAIDAMLAGKDVYCEKPLTLTIDEGRQVAKVVRRTGRVLQVGTQQRSGEYGGQFLTAVALVRAGRIGRVERVTVGLPPGRSGGPFPAQPAPPDLDWDLWLGQAPWADYCPERYGTHHWWYEYAGGSITNWGAHHVDIAQWAIRCDHTGPLVIEGTATHPNVPGGYNTATAFNVSCRFAGGIEMLIRSDVDNGILFEGERGRFFVNRGRLTGAPVERLRDDPLPADAVAALGKGKPPASFGKLGAHRPGNHMANFFACVADRSEPISDAFSHHRTITTCHLANICIRQGRRLAWNPDQERIVGDPEADAWQQRPQRKPYAIVG
jgi:predicted dehydrogenase